MQRRSTISIVLFGIFLVICIPTIAFAWNNDAITTFWDKVINSNFFATPSSSIYLYEVRERGNTPVPPPGATAIPYPLSDCPEDLNTPVPGGTCLLKTVTISNSASPITITRWTLVYQGKVILTPPPCPEDLNTPTDGGPCLTKTISVFNPGPPITITLGPLINPEDATEPPPPDATAIPPGD